MADSSEIGRLVRAIKDGSSVYDVKRTEMGEHFGSS
jgi:hypothetical protein